ncbi:hypothetical protein, partial [Xanthomonas oryzae]|uniref:hypothetical protein n=1 Tax=Xanthomonas oryzae TaxID=347 RepID=UPI001C675C61
RNPRTRIRHVRITGGKAETAQSLQRGVRHDSGHQHLATAPALVLRQHEYIAQAREGCVI